MPGPTSSQSQLATAAGGRERLRRFAKERRTKDERRRPPGATRRMR